MSILKKVKAAGIGLACMAMCAFGGLTAQAANLVWPVPGHTTLSQGYHDGGAIDISDGSIGGAKIVAAIGGTVTYKYTCGTQHYGSYGDCNGFGTGIVINGDDGRIYQYAHMQANSIPSNVYKGARVEAGQTIGAVGKTGYASGNHLHFGISKGQYWYASGINPLNETYTNVTASISYQNLKATSVTKTNANLYGKIINSSRTQVTYVGVNIWDSNGTQVVKHSEYCGLNYSSFNQYLDVNKEAGVTLKSGTTYTFQMWATAGGKTYTSAKGTFRTSGTAQTTKKSQSISASNKTKTLGCAGFLATKTVTITVNPKGTSLFSARNLSGKKIQLCWYRNSAVTGYQIQVCTNRKFSGAGTVRVSKNTYTGLKLTGGTKGRTYYFRIRTYKTVSGTMYYSGWSGTKSVKITR